MRFAEMLLGKEIAPPPVGAGKVFRADQNPKVKVAQAVAGDELRAQVQRAKERPPVDPMIAVRAMVGARAKKKEAKKAAVLAVIRKGARRIREIETRTGYSEQAIRNYTNELEDEGLIFANRLPPGNRVIEFFAGAK